MSAYEVQVPICPLCAAPCGQEGGWDGIEHVWTCDHGGRGDEPTYVPLRVFQDAALLERTRSSLCMVEWVAAATHCQQRREQQAETDYATLRHPIGLTYTPADRKARHKFRRLPRTSQFDRIIKRLYCEPIREALNRGNVFTAAVLGETRDATIDIHHDIDWQAFGGDFVVPLKGDE